MTFTLAGALAALALIDSTSFGTLMIPLWLMLAPGKMRVGRIVLFLVTVATFYFGVGLAIMFGAEAAVAQVGDFFDSRLALTVLLAAGVGLVIWSFLLEAKAKREKKEGAPPSARILRWRERAVGSDASGPDTSGTIGSDGVGAVRSGGVGSGGVALMGLAVGAATIEVATMLPYLGAIGLLTTSNVKWPLTGVVLAGYCLVMILPALAILVLRLVAARRVDPALKKFDGWLTRNSTNTLSWVVGIIGVLLIVNTAGEVF